MRASHQILRSTVEPMTRPGRMLRPDLAEELIEEGARFRETVATSPVIIADPVAQYYSSHPQAHWDRVDDFPELRPPFASQVIEWEIPRRLFVDGAWVEHPLASMSHFAALVESVPAAAIGARFRQRYGAPPRSIVESVARHAAASETVVSITPCAICYGQALLIQCPSLVFVDSDSRWVAEITLPILEEMGGDANTWVPIVLMTLTFLNCKGVRTLDVTETEGPGEKWLRRQRLPRLRYSIVDVQPGRAASARGDAAESDEDRTGKALHIARGHFKRFTADAPRFGRLEDGVGTFWCPSHVRGDRKFGAVVKDYVVGVPAGAT